MASSKINNDFKMDDFSEFMKYLEDEAKKLNPNHERDQRFMELVQPYLHMTEDEMKVAIPHGCYEISGNGMIAFTGKGGLIMTILAMQKQLKNIGDETKRN